MRQLLITLFLLSAWRADASARTTATALTVHPTSLELRGARSMHGLVVSWTDRSGHSVDVTRQAHFFSEEPDRVMVDERGQCRVKADGAGAIVVEFGGEKVRVPFVAAETGQAKPPSFAQEILPVLTRNGCNSGGCHGKLAGQNGFRLSLRAYAPDWDFDWLTSEVQSRRINFAEPAESLILQKATGAIPHEGGARFAEKSRPYQMLREWIAARAPGLESGEAKPVQIAILPGNRTLRAGEVQQLLVQARYDSGELRDVSWVSQFFSNDESTVSVSPEGLVKALRQGEAAVRVHFQGLVQVVTITIPFEQATPPGLFGSRRHPIDRAVMEKLQALHIPPSGLADDATFMRRLHVDATGSLPRPEEVRRFLGSRNADKRAQLVEELLNRPEFVDYWTLQLADLLQNRKERDHDVRGTKGVRAFQAWLRGEVAANRPWDQLAREVIRARGDSTTHPEVGYYIVTVGEKDRVEESEITDSVAQSFLGTRIGCARCHNHPLEKFTQDDYYHFAAFFSRISLERNEPAKGPTVLQAWTREEGRQRKEIQDLEVKLREKRDDTKLQEKLEQARKKLGELRETRKPGVDQPRTHQFMAPQPLDRAALTFEPGEDPRDKLADWVANPANENFAGNMVNRIWKHFMGVGLVEPVDDLRASNPPTNPALWQALKSEFVSHQYDLKHLIRFVVTSRTYQLASDTLPGNERDSRFYSHYYARRLPAEVLLDAISQACEVPDSFSGYPVGMRAVQLPEPGVSSYFLGLFGRSERVTACACERSGEVTLPQLLHLNNGEEIEKKLRSEEGRVARLLKAGKTDAELAEELFLAALGRKPSAREAAAVRSSFAQAEGRAAAGQDLFWALLNSKEFAFNH